MWNRLALILTFLVAFAFHAPADSAKPSETATDLVYFNEDALLRVKSAITAMQIFERGGVLPADVKTQMRAWMEQYLDWLLHSQLGKEADALPQNHANWYNYQVVGLMIYLGRTQQAKTKVEDAKQSRIAAQITPDGRQPRETGRTKSMHYSTMNLWALANLTFMGRKVGVDLWEFETPDKRSLRQAYRFLEPYALGEKDWPYKQITKGGARETIRAELRPLFAKTSALLRVELLSGTSDVNLHLSALDFLRYPPEDELP